MTATTSPKPSDIRAAVDAPPRGDGAFLQLVSFVVGAEEFAIPILSVREINRMMPITRVPQSPAFIEGVGNLRGKIIPVVGLRKRFGLPARGDSPDARIVVVEVADRVIGLAVDRVNEVLRIRADVIEPPPEMICGIESDYVEGVGKFNNRLLILLNLGRLFNDRQFAEADKAVEDAKTDD